MTPDRQHLDLTTNAAIGALDEAIAISLTSDDCDSPDVSLDWERDKDGSWVAPWIYSEDVDCVKTWLANRYDVTCSVSHGTRPDYPSATWLRVAPAGAL